MILRYFLNHKNNILNDGISQRGPIFWEVLINHKLTTKTFISDEIIDYELINYVFHLYK